MQSHRTSRWSLAAACAAGLLWPVSSFAQSGHARAVQATVGSPLGVIISTLGDTGTLGGSTDARDASAITGSIGSLLTGETLHATTIGWPDQVASEASLGDLVITIAGNTITAGFVHAKALSAAGGSALGAVVIDSLRINGVAIDVDGTPNQSVTIPGGGIVINEQTASASGLLVNALHIVINNIADVVIASASANAQ